MVEILLVVWLAVTVVLFVAGMQNAELARAARQRINVIDTVFQPWLASIDPNAPDADARLDVHAAAWQRWRAVAEPEVPAPARWFDKAIEFAERRTAGRSPSSEGETK